MTVSIYVGDCIEVLRTLPAESVHCVVTSPPYYGLRDYNVEGQMGLEDSPDAYVAKLVDVFREVRRVLHPTGTVWLNIGDSYASSGTVDETGFKRLHEYKRPNGTPHGGRGRGGKGRAPTPPGLKPKDLMMIPARVALALQADGWWLRSQVIWHKPNAMPESVTDRPTTDYECVYLLAKSERYFYDADAIRERSADPEGSAERYKSSFGGVKNEHLLATDQVHTRPIGMREFDGRRNKRTVWTIPTRSFSAAHFATFPPDLVEPMILAGCPKGGTVLDPFAGAGTTGLVADRLERDAILIELNPDYAEMSARRIYDDAGMFAEVEVHHDLA